ncbi:MAG: hypothetical protein P8J87_07125, partial [Verrucomicrobiales bacterium]|nr:hypothetical protein [Verrucomicrobiales bacterium]
PSSQIIGIMAGGDAALVRSIESFEDHPEWGARMLADLGFAPGDLLIATTEGGETPYVIGATEYAADHSATPPFFLYCNPDDILARVARRSAAVLADPRIQKINLTVGPMAITGSTRMQASTVLMAAVGWAIAHRGSPAGIQNSAAAFSSLLGSTDLAHLTPFTTFEAGAYRAGDYLLYDPGTMGITVITDTTERSPTFSLTPFENHNRPEDPPSLSYLHLPGTPDSTTAWNILLNRPPNNIGWPALAHLTGKNTTLGFDFSDQLPRQRAIRTNNAQHHQFKIRTTPDAIRFTLGDLHHAFPTPGASPFHQHLLLKLLLNTHSTLVMGRLGRYRGNLMTYVSPTNHKLVDRAARYVSQLLAQKAITPIPYETIVRQIFHDRADLPNDEPIVLKTLNHFLPT